MIDPTLGTALISSLASAIIDKETIKKAIDLLLYNARTFLETRRGKLSDTGPASETDDQAQDSDKPPEEMKAASEPSSPEKPAVDHLPEETKRLRIDPKLSEVELSSAEREIESLLTRLTTHHEMLIIKQEQAVAFGEFVPAYMTLAIRNEQRAIIKELGRLREIIAELTPDKVPDIELLASTINK